MSLDETDPSYNAINLIINAVRNYEPDVVADASHAVAAAASHAVASHAVASHAVAAAASHAVAAAASHAVAAAAASPAATATADNIDEEENNKLDWGDTSKYCSGGMGSVVSRISKNNLTTNNDIPHRHTLYTSEEDLTDEECFSNNETEVLNTN